MALKSIPFHKMKKRIFLWLYFLLHAVPSWCQDTLVYQGQDSDITKIGRFLSFYEDKSHSLTFEAVQQMPDSLFHQIDADELNFGESKSKIWFKINIQNQTEEPLYIINEVPIFRWELWTLSENGELLHQKTGIMESYTSRFFRVTDLNFSIGKHAKTLIMSIEGHSSLIASFKISTIRPLVSWTHQKDIFTGVFLGWMLLVFFYNLFIFIQLRDTLYLWYCLYVITCVFANIRIEGIGFGLLWPDYPAFNRWVDIPNLINSIVVVVFATRFLQTHAILPKYHRFLQLYMILLAFMSVLEILDIRPLSNHLTMISFFVTCGVLWWVAFLTFKKGFKQARYYLLGWSFFLMSVIVATLWRVDLIDHDDFWIKYSFLIGTMIEAALFSFALADRIRIYRSEMETARSLSLQRLEENEKLLLEYNRILERNLTLETSQAESSKKSMITQPALFQRLSIPTLEGVLFIPTNDIIRLEALGSYCTIHLSENKKIVASRPMIHFEEMLSEGFMRVHKSHVVNLAKVVQYVRGEGGILKMSDRSEVPVSRTAKAELMKRLQLG